MSYYNTKPTEDIPTALYHAALGRMVLDYVKREDTEAIRQAMESRAVSTLEEIRRILDDDTLNDAECFYKIDELVMLFFRALEVRTQRHQEAE